MKTKTILLLPAFFMAMSVSAQDYPIHVSENEEKMMEGKFAPTWESLSNYKVPEWFQDAKFGIWAHWGPQCVEGTGDWMGRYMYMEGSDAYKYHVKHYKKVLQRYTIDLSKPTLFRLT